MVIVVEDTKHSYDFGSRTAGALSNGYRVICTGAKDNQMRGVLHIDVQRRNFYGHGLDSGIREYSANIPQMG